MTEPAFHPHRLTIRVYWEDTDAGGIVYHANYLNFMERGRTEMLRDLGVDQSRLRGEDGVIFVVKRLNLTYEGSAVLDDVLQVETSVAALGGASLTLHQNVMRDGIVLAAAEVVIVCVGDGKAKRIPQRIRDLFASRL